MVAFYRLLSLGSLPTGTARPGVVPRRFSLHPETKAFQTMCDSQTPPRIVPGALSSGARQGSFRVLSALLAFRQGLFRSGTPVLSVCFYDPLWSMPNLAEANRDYLVENAFL